jgi:hypothetical protein
MESFKKSKVFTRPPAVILSLAILFIASCEEPESNEILNTIGPPPPPPRIVKSVV